MAHFAQLDDNNVVIRVVVAEQDFINTGALGDPSRFVQASYNKRIRKNYPGPGYSYDVVRDAFIPPKPFDSWVLNESTCTYEPPLKRTSLDHEWDEVKNMWVKNRAKRI